MIGWLLLLLSSSVCLAAYGLAYPRRPDRVEWFVATGAVLAVLSGSTLG